MPRAAIFTLLVAFFSAGSLYAQHAGGTYSNHIAGVPGASGFAGQASFPDGLAGRHGFANGFFPAHPQRHPWGHGPVLLPYFWPAWYEPVEAEAAANEGAPPVVILQGEPGREPTRNEPRRRPQVIEIPGIAATATKPLPPTVFILTSGERLEARRFVLTATRLSLTLDHHQRTFPADQIDVDATLAAQSRARHRIADSH